MSPARLSIEEMSESELSFNGDMWSAQPNKKQKMQHAKTDIDLVDDLETLWETKWKSAVSTYLLSPPTPTNFVCHMQPRPKCLGFPPCHKRTLQELSD